MGVVLEMSEDERQMGIFMEHLACRQVVSILGQLGHHSFSGISRKHLQLIDQTLGNALQNRGGATHLLEIAYKVANCGAHTYMIVNQILLWAPVLVNIVGGAEHIGIEAKKVGSRKGEAGNRRPNS